MVMGRGAMLVLVSMFTPPGPSGGPWSSWVLWEVGREESYIEGSIRVIREISSMAAPE
jgi:hypothetical protein